MARVLHSQSLNSPCLKVWVAVDIEGFIKTAHCTCVAGLGECCRHVEATLFALEVANRNQTEANMVYFKDVAAYWRVPSCKNKLQVASVDIQWSTENVRRSQPLKETRPPAKEEVNNFFETLRKNGVEAVGATPIDKQVTPTTIGMDRDIEVDFLVYVYTSNFYKVKYCNLSSNLLKTVARQIDYGMSIKCCKIIEWLTRAQYKCGYWHTLRLGRITASIFKKASRTNLSSVSMSLPNLLSSNRFDTSDKYGCRHEVDVIDYILSVEKCRHKQPQIRKCGIFVDSKKSTMLVLPTDCGYVSVVDPSQLK